MAVSAPPWLSNWLSMLEGIGLRILGFALDWIADRTNARMRLDAHSGFLMGWVGNGGGSSVSHHEARLFVYNAGRRRFTVNKQTGWRHGPLRA